MLARGAVTAERRTRTRPTRLDRRRADEDIVDHLVGGVRLTRVRPEHPPQDNVVASAGHTLEHRIERRRGRSAEELKKNLDELLAEWERRQVEPKPNTN
jgi:hypothetical protein